MDLLLSLWPGASQALDQTILHDPEFALAHAARARLNAIHARPWETKVDIEHAELLVARNGTERERSHVGVLSLAINGRAKGALAAALNHVHQWPRDVLILSLPLGAFGLFAFSGMANHDQARVDLCERYSKHFAADDWWFLTYRGWAHAENGNLHLGRQLTQRALELRRWNVNGAHAMAHVLHESGADMEAQYMIADWLPEYDRSGILHGHIAWHGALIALEQGDVHTALDYYMGNVAPSVSHGTPVNIISDSASFLWRLDAYGHDVPHSLWQEAASYASDHFQQPGFAFADFHMALIEAATGKQDALERRRHILSQMGKNNDFPVGPVASMLCLAVRAFASGEYAECARALEPIASQVVRIGGSGAQREIVDDMLVVALMKAGDVSGAKSALNRRLNRRPSQRDDRWLNSLSAN
ncbi:tetratricopeptide repeat protein [Pseudomonas alliivorans]|nr:tetratricopeptide repeat protein [Pseudomonas alliivorans]